MGGATIRGGNGHSARLGDIRLADAGRRSRGTTDARGAFRPFWGVARGGLDTWEKQAGDTTKPKREICLGSACPSMPGLHSTWYFGRGESLQLYDII